MSAKDVPEVEVGDLVYWYERADTGRRPYVCLVEAVNSDSLDLQVLSIHWRGMLKQGVRHISDERLRTNPEWAKMGGWDVRRAARSVHDSLSRLAKTEELLTELLQRTPAKRGDLARKDV